MKCYANRVTTKLMGIPSGSPVSVTINGPGFRILPEQGDRLGDTTQEFKFVTTMAFSGGAESPTAQIVIQGSSDGVTWLDIVSGTSRTADGTYLEAIDSANVGLLPWVRARLVLGGGTNPNVSLSVDLVSTGPFQLSNS